MNLVLFILVVLLLYSVYKLNTRKDRFAVGVRISLKVDDIRRFLNKEGHTTVVKQEYSITTLPFGENLDLFFHHKNNAITQSLWGFDYVDGINIEYFVRKDELIVTANDTLIMFAPLHLAVEIQKNNTNADFSDKNLSRLRLEKKMNEKLPNGRVVNVELKDPETRGVVVYKSECAEVMFHVINNSVIYDRVN